MRLVVVDVQNIFTDPDSPWASPMWPEVEPNIARLLERFDDPIFTRWLAPTDRGRAWGPYMEEWPNADVPDDDQLLNLVDGMPAGDVVSARTFGKWEEIKNLGGTDHVVVCGLATDCCVITTVLGAVDDGAWVTVISDACGGAARENHDVAIAAMSYFPPHVTVMTTDEFLSAHPGNG